MKSAMSRKKKILIIIIIVVVIAAGTGAILIFKPFHSNASRFSSDYVLMDNDNVFVYKSARQTADFLETGTGVVFMGFPACPWCQTYVPILNEVAKEMGIDEIIYLDILIDRTMNSAQYKRLVEMKAHHLETDDNGKPRIYVPDVTVVKDGVIVGHDNETCTISDMDPTDYWTISKVEALRQRLREMIELIQ